MTKAIISFQIFLLMKIYLNQVCSENKIYLIVFSLIKNIGCFCENTIFVNNYQHLFGGAYNLTYKVKTVLGVTLIKYNINISKCDKEPEMDFIFLKNVS